jgi:hypothetical protein
MKFRKCWDHKFISWLVALIQTLHGEFLHEYMSIHTRQMSAPPAPHSHSRCGRAQSDWSRNIWGLHNTEPLLSKHGEVMCTYMRVC